jgi:hypothetical protein
MAAGGPNFASIEEVVERFGEQKYICNRAIATTVYLASALRKPVLVEGPPRRQDGAREGHCGHARAGAHPPAVLRGLDEAKALYEWEYGKQLLYTQILKDKISEVLAGAATLVEAIDRIAAQDGVFFSERFILPPPADARDHLREAGGATRRRDRQVRIRSSKHFFSRV